MNHRNEHIDPSDYKAYDRLCIKCNRPGARIADLLGLCPSTIHRYRQGSLAIPMPIWYATLWICAHVPTRFKGYTDRIFATETRARHKEWLEEYKFLREQIQTRALRRVYRSSKKFTDAEKKKFDKIQRENEKRRQERKDLRRRTNVDSKRGRLCREYDSEDGAD